jgi:hypothetical protein
MARRYQMSLSLPEDLQDSIDRLLKQMVHLTTVLNELTKQSQAELRTQIVEEAKSVMPEKSTSPWLTSTKKLPMPLLYAPEHTTSNMPENPHYSWPWCDQLVKVDIDDQIYSTFFYFAHEQNGHMPLVRALVSMNIGDLAEIRKEIMDIAVQAMDAAMNEAELSRIAIQANFSGIDQAGLPEEQLLQHAGYSHAWK